MARVVVFALFLCGASSPAWSQAPPNGEISTPPSAWRMPPDVEVARSYARPADSREYESRDRGNSMFAGTEVAPNATFGLGVFGLKPERTRQAPVTGRELGMPRTRRAGVGLRLKF